MFISLTEEPRVVDCYRSGSAGYSPIIQVRVAEREASGRLWMSVQFKSEEELKAYVNGVVQASSEHLPLHERPALPYPNVAPARWSAPVQSK